MAVEITPGGTRGQQMPGWGFKIANWLAVPIYKLMGKRFPGLPLLLLTTVGAKSGQERKTTRSGSRSTAGGSKCGPSR